MNSKASKKLESTHGSAAVREEALILKQRESIRRWACVIGLESSLILESIVVLYTGPLLKFLRVEGDKVRALEPPAHKELFCPADMT